MINDFQLHSLLFELIPNQYWREFLRSNPPTEINGDLERRRVSFLYRFFHDDKIHLNHELQIHWYVPTGHIRQTVNADKRITRASFGLRFERSSNQYHLEEPYLLHDWDCTKLRNILHRHYNT